MRATNTGRVPAAGPRTLSVRQAALHLGCGLKRVYDLIWAGQLEARKVRARWRIPLAAVEERQKAKEKASGAASR